MYLYASASLRTVCEAVCINRDDRRLEALLDTGPFSQQHRDHGCDGHDGKVTRHERALHDGGLHALVDRGGDDDIAAGEGGAPVGDAVTVNVGNRSCVVKGIEVVLLLHIRVDFKAGFALALAPVAVVVNEGGETSLLETRREVIQVMFFEARELE
jgi:hypothetical protein